jgi:transcriptional regulator with XRE-family HTH domain
MPQEIDPEWLGQQLQKKRKERGLTLQQVANETGISVATLSRIERGESPTVTSNTLVTLTDWIGTKVELLRKEPEPVKVKGKVVTDLPKIVELHLRADKNLDRKTATALANLFRSVYEQVKEQTKKKD